MYKRQGCTDDEALYAFNILCKTEGIIPALETSHAIHYAMELAKNMGSGKNIVVNLSGRGDEDLNTVSKIEGIKIWIELKKSLTTQKQVVKSV